MALNTVRLATGPDHRVDYVALAPGGMIGRYEILAVLGQGGFGITYRAHDSQLDREVAIKEYLPVALAVRQDGASVLPRSTEAADDFGWGRQRFIDEGRTLATLQDASSIVKVFDFLEENGTAYLVMELLRGQTLEQRLASEGPLTPVELDMILDPLLDGLEKVHAAGFLHRDIKPANILLGEGNRPTLIDFGASRAAMADRTTTMTAIFTPGYAAPEQLNSSKQGPWTDIYCLGATLYHAIAGEPPPSAFDRLMEDECQPLDLRQPPGYARGLLRGVDAALAVHLEDRPRSIAEWRTLLQRELPTGGAATVVMDVPRVSARPVTPPTPPTPPSPPTIGGRLVAPRRRWSTWGAVMALLASMVAVGGYYLLRPGPAPEATHAPSEQQAAAPDRPAPAAAPSAEQEEALLQLNAGDRQRVQLALSALGFDTQGSDGSFGPRSREMIAAWQKARGHASTGYLTANQKQALSREAQPALQRLDEEKRKPAVPSTPAVADGVYVGSLSISSTAGGQSALRPVQAELSLIGRQATGKLVYYTCGTLPISLAVDPSGAISGSLRIPEANGCSLGQATASGRIAGGSMSLDIRGVDSAMRGTLSAPAARTMPNPVQSGQRTDGP